MILAEQCFPAGSPLTDFPPPDTPLPPCMLRGSSIGSEHIEPVPLSAMQSVKVGEIGRQAQAVYLLNELIELMNSTNHDEVSLGSKFVDLDERMRYYLDLLLKQENPFVMSSPASVALSIR